MKLIAKHQIYLAHGKIVMPGEHFEVADSEVEDLVAAGAVDEVIVPSAANAPAGKKHKAAAADADL